MCEILKIRFLREKVAFTWKVRCRVSFHQHLTWAHLGFSQRKKRWPLKICSYGFFLSLSPLMSISSHGNYTEMAWESDIYKCSVRSVLPNALKFKPWFVIYSELRLTYSEGLWKDNILNAKTRHVTARCQFNIVLFIDNQKEPYFPCLPSGDPGKAAALLNIEWGGAPPSTSFLISAGSWCGHQVRDTCSRL